VLEVWVAYVADRTYAWRMLFRDTGGGPEIQAFRHGVHARARAVLVEMIELLREGEIPDREREPLAELMSMGMASVVLWAMDDGRVGDDTIVDALTRVWAGLLRPAD
jgi:hypothetical protein